MRRHTVAAAIGGRDETEPMTSDSTARGGVGGQSGYILCGSLAAPPPPSTSPPLTVTKDYQRTTLDAHHRPVVRALAEAMFSPNGEVSSENLDAFVENVNGYISPTSKTLRFGFVMMLFGIRWSPLLFGRFRTFDELAVDERVAHLIRLEHSSVKPLTLLVVAYKTILTMLFYEDEAEQRALGYPGDGERKRWLRGQRALPVVQAKAEESAA